MGAALMALAVTAAAETRPAAPAARPQTYAVLVGGMPSSPVFARRYQDWLTRFHALLTRSGVPAGNIVMLSGDANFKSPVVNGPATRDSIVAAIGEAAKKVRPEDQFVLVIVGHGSLSDAKPGLVLHGADLDPETLGKALAGINADNQVVLNFAGASGDFLKALAKKGRVNVAATLAEENVEPAFAEFFLRGIESNRADGEGGAKDGVVTLLEAYNWATHQTALWIMRQVGNKEGTWTVNGKESVEIFHKLYDGPESNGPLSNDGSRKLSAESDGTKPDDVVPLVVPPDLKPNTAQDWKGRRIVNEHAQVEDLGQESGLSALRGEQGYDPIVVGKDEEGAKAARVVLGRPELLALPGK
jgi:hypothetical protein